jgi:ABC-type branched-chain amino acid transport systems, periplasmic component
MLSGIRLYLDQLNRNGGINGRKVTLEVYDDKGDRDTAIKVSNGNTQKKQKTLVVLGHYFSRLFAGCQQSVSKIKDTCDHRLCHSRKNYPKK